MRLGNNALVPPLACMHFGRIEISIGAMQLQKSATISYKTTSKLISFHTIGHMSVTNQWYGGSLYNQLQNYFFRSIEIVMLHNSVCMQFSWC